MLNDFVVNIGSGLVIAALAGWIVRFMRRNWEDIKTLLLTFDTKLEKLLNIDLPDQWQTKVHSWVEENVVWMEKYALDARFWRGVLRKCNPHQAQVLYNLLKDTLDKGLSPEAEEQLGNLLMEKLPGDIKLLVNQEKHEIVVNAVQAKVALLVPEEAKPSKEAISGQVAAFATACKTAKEPIGIRKPEIQEMVEELRKKVETQK